MAPHDEFKILMPTNMEENHCRVMTFGDLGEPRDVTLSLIPLAC